MLLHPSGSYFDTFGGATIVETMMLCICIPSLVIGEEGGPAWIVGYGTYGYIFEDHYYSNDIEILCTKETCSFLLRLAESQGNVINRIDVVKRETI